MVFFTAPSLAQNPNGRSILDSGADLFGVYLLQGLLPGAHGSRAIVGLAHLGTHVWPQKELLPIQDSEYLVDLAVVAGAMLATGSSLRNAGILALAHGAIHFGAKMYL